VPQAKLRRLYERIATGLVDAELLDDVGYRLYARCQSILVVDGLRKRRELPCPACGSIVSLGDDWTGTDPEKVIHCQTCGWSLRWGDYWGTFRHQELGPGGATDIFEDFLNDWSEARTERAKILAIDRVIHRWHWETAEVLPAFGLGRPSGVNLIEGNRHDVIAFLDQLTYGDSTPPEVRAFRDTWRAGLESVRERAERAKRPRSASASDGRLSRDDRQTPVESGDRL
jgi:hypothetical protein